MTERTISYGRYTLRHDWPADCFVQGSQYGKTGLLKDPDHTAFVEVSPREPSTFIRGEGAGLAAAEDVAWAKYQRVLSCPGHEFDPRGYTNGAGFCRHCGMFASNVFTAEDLGLFCPVCGVPTLYDRYDGKTYCEAHTPNRARIEESRAQYAAWEAEEAADPERFAAEFDAALRETLTRLAGPAAAPHESTGEST